MRFVVSALGRPRTSHRNRGGSRPSRGTELSLFETASSAFESDSYYFTQHQHGLSLDRRSKAILTTTPRRSSTPPGSPSKSIHCAPSKPSYARNAFDFRVFLFLISIYIVTNTQFTLCSRCSADTERMTQSRNLTDDAHALSVYCGLGDSSACLIKFTFSHHSSTSSSNIIRTSCYRPQKSARHSSRRSTLALHRNHLQTPLDRCMTLPLANSVRA